MRKISAPVLHAIVRNSGVVGGLFWRPASQVVHLIVVLDIDRLHLGNLRNHLITQVLLRFSLFGRHIFMGLLEDCWLCLHPVVGEDLLVSHGLVTVIICVLEVLTEIGRLVLVRHRVVKTNGGVCNIGGHGLRVESLLSEIVYMRIIAEIHCRLTDGVGVRLQKLIADLRQVLK